MALTNAQRQARWRDKRNEDAATLSGKTPREIAENLFRHFGVKDAKRVQRALDKLLRNIKPDCPRCHGTGFEDVQAAMHPCAGMFKGRCDCKPPEPDGWHVVRDHGGGHYWVGHDRYTTEAEAEKAAAEFQAHHDSLERKPQGVGPYVVVTSQELAGDDSNSCPVS
jgi:hypothetical protein